MQNLERTGGRDLEDSPVQSKDGPSTERKDRYDQMRMSYPRSVNAGESANSDQVPHSAKMTNKSKKPLIYLDVDIGAGDSDQKERIEIYRDDDPR